MHIKAALTVLSAHKPPIKTKCEFPVRSRLIILSQKPKKNSVRSHRRVLSSKDIIEGVTGSARTTPAFGAEDVSLGDFLDKRATALTVSEVAEILSISERQVYKLASESVIPSFRIGSSIRFDPSQVAAWLRQKAAPISVRPGEDRRKRA
jgi:excisionase family DNA binding protein